MNNNNKVIWNLWTHQIKMSWGIDWANFELNSDGFRIVKIWPIIIELCTTITIWTIDVQSELFDIKVSESAA